MRQRLPDSKISDEAMRRLDIKTFMSHTMPQVMYVQLGEG